MSRVVDPVRFAEAPVVLRVRRAGVAEGDKYHWTPVEVLAVLKNDSEYAFPPRVHLAHLGWEPGVPAEVSTVYLERYNATDRPDSWKLLGGSGGRGVSHAAGAPGP